MLGFVHLAGAAQVYQVAGDPAQTPHPTIEVVIDGRIDNHATLCRVLGLHVSSSAECLVAEAYRRWDTAAFKQLVGDFAIVVRDSQRRRLLLARDPFGTRPLFWAGSTSSVSWSSDAAELARRTKASVYLTDQYVAGFLTGTEDVMSTPFRGVTAVRPATCVRFDRGQIAIEEGWHPDPQRTVQFSDDRDYEAVFLELLCESVHARPRPSCVRRAERRRGLVRNCVGSSPAGIDGPIVRGPAHYRHVQLSKLPNISREALFIDR